LYLSGSIPAEQGNIGNHIIRYNGEEWKTVGEPLCVQPNSYPFSSPIRHTYIKGDYLYAIGTFEYSGSVPMHAAARWDGDIWCGLNTDDFLVNTMPGQDGILEGGFFQDQFMIYITHENDEGEFQPHWLHDGSVGTDNCSEPVSVKDVTNGIFNVYPNPVTSKSTIYIEAVSEIESYRLIDYLGRELKINSNS